MTQRLRNAAIKKVDFSKKRILVFGFAAVAAGIITLISHAASPFVSLEPENGALTGAATAGVDSLASNGKYAQFGSITQVTGTSYYVDCTAGSDNNNGTSQSLAWQTVTKANAASLVSGDGLFFKKGCTFNSALTVKWNGVTVSSYGTGNLPIFQTSTNNTNVVNVTGSSNNIDGLQATANAPSTDPNCGSNPVGHIVGFNFSSGANNNNLKNSIATGAYAGVYINSGSSGNHILNNQLLNNTMMSPLDTAADNDAGAFGVLLWGNNNEIANNQIDGSDACSYDYVRDGSAVEVFNGSGNNIHNNKANNDNTFTELGKDSSHTSDGNIFAYNQFVTNASNGIFLNTRGSGNTFGPVTNTKAYNNSAYVTGSSSPGGVICSNCGTNILTLKNNIIWDNAKALYASAAFDESNNIYWSSNGSPVIQNAGSSTVAASSKKADPKWTVNGSDFHLQSTSPAIDAGINESITAGFSKDLDNHTVPAGSAVDVGAYEFGSVAVRKGGVMHFVAKVMNSAKHVFALLVKPVKFMGNMFYKAGSSFMHSFDSRRVEAAGTVSSTTPCVGNPAPAAWKHVIVLMFENHTYSGGATAGVIGTKDSSGSLEAPYITNLVSQCGSYKDWHDADYKVNGTKEASYISKPNYATLTNGLSPSQHGLLDDSSGTTTGVDNIYNQLRSAGKSGKDYYDGSSGVTGCGGSFSGSYHDAIRYYTNIDSTYCNAHDVNLSTFMTDVNNNTLPEFSMLLPTNCENMHSCSGISDVIKNGDTWASNFLPQLLDSARYKSGDTAIFFLWDEDTPIPNVLMAPSISPNTLVPTPSGNPISHFSALRTFEEMLGLPFLGNTAQAPSLLSFYNGSSTPTPPPPPPPPQDTTPPTVSITSPANNASVSGSSVNVAANASDNVGVSKVEFYVNNTLTSTDTSSPYGFTWNTASLASGTYTLKATAYDAAGNTTNSTVTVNFVASGCSTVSTALGTDSLTVNVPSSGTYHVWSRIQVPDTTNNSYYLQVDSGCATVVGDSTGITPNSWVWVNYKDGNSATAFDTTVTSGNHTFMLIGRENGVKVDKVLLTSDTCVPTGTGTNCETVADTTSPIVSVTAPTNGSTVSGSSVTVSANASDNVGVAGVQFKLDGSNLGSEDTTSPYSTSWNTTLASNGTHTLSAVARDAAGNSTTASNVSVSVNNVVTPPPPPPAPKAGDINGDSSVNITDLSLLLSSYGQNTTQCTTNAAYKCDLSSPGDGSVNIFDLSILLSQYGT